MRRAMNVLIVLGGVIIGGCKHEAESVPPVSVKEPVEFDSAHQQLAKILEQVTDGLGLWIMKYCTVIQKRWRSI